MIGESHNNRDVKRVTGTCRDCDWRGAEAGASSRGKLISCSWFGSNRVVEEMQNCPGWTRDLRLKGEARSDFLARQDANRLDSKRHKLALRAHRLAIIALVISGLSFLAILVKLLIDTLSKGTITTP